MCLAYRQIEKLAEGNRFGRLEPLGSPVFKTGAIDHSAIPPKNFADPRIGSNDHLPVTIRAFSVPVVTVLAPLATTHRVLNYAGSRDSNLLQKNMVGDERVELPCKHYQCFIIDRYINRLKLDASCFYVAITPRGFHDPGGTRTRIFNFA